MDKAGVRKCVGNMACTLEKLLHDVDSEIMSKCAVDISVLRSNINSIEMLLDLDKRPHFGEDDKHDK